MQRLLRTLILSIIFMAFSAIAEQPSSNIYYINGINRHDGMSATINANKSFIRIAGDIFPIKKCDITEYELCFESEYFNFSKPFRNEEREWLLNDDKFELRGFCDYKLNNEIHHIIKILSVQKNKLIIFFYDVNVGIVGWEFRYKTINQSDSSYVYLLGSYAKIKNECTSFGD